MKYARQRIKRHNRSQRPLIRRAFTLVEIMVVVTIIALLATLVVPRLFKSVGRAKQGKAQQGVSTIAQQVQLWMLDNNFSRLPDDFELDLLVDGDDPYLEPDDLLDPWENPYVIIAPGDKHRDFDIVSYGADGAKGGEIKTEDEDIVN